MRKTLSMFLVILIMITCMTNIGVFAKTFPDVPKKHPNYDAVASLTEMGVIAGYDDGTFQPAREITRTEFCALMARTLGCNKETYKVKKVPFSDVKKDYWGIAFISFCYEKGLINGMGDGTFAPADKVTMAQATKMAVCALGKEKEAISKGGKKWYSGYVNIADKYGILDYTDQKPDENAVRVNVAQIVYNMVESGLILEDEDVDPDGIMTEKPEVIPEKPASKPDDSGKNPVIKPEDSDKKPVSPDKTDKDEEKVETRPINPETPVKNPDSGLRPNNIPGITFTDKELAEIDRIFAEKDYSQVKVIVIDPGHNYSGADIGARIDSLGVREEIITWQIADKLRQKLQKMGYTVYMTRNKVNDNIDNSSTSASLKARVDYAHKMLADLYISIHCNMGGGRGSETYCFSRGGYSSRLAELIQKKLVASTGFNNRGVKTAKFYVIKNTAMPSVLVETAFMDSAEDREVLLSEEGQDAIAQAIADSVKEYDAMKPIARSVEAETTDENKPAVASESSETDTETEKNKN